MKNDIKYRYNILKNFIYDNDTRKKCRLENKKYENSFSRKRKLPFYDILLMTLNKQGKNVSLDFIHQVEDWINNLLRPMFGFKSSLEMAKIVS